MNIFRLLGDLSHLAAINLLVTNIWIRRSSAGISGKTQLLSLMVFVTRYLDLFTNFVSVYNTVMKIFFILSAAFIVYSIFIKFKVLSLGVLQWNLILSFRRRTKIITTSSGCPSC